MFPSVNVFMTVNSFWNRFLIFDLKLSSHLHPVFILLVFGLYGSVYDSISLQDTRTHLLSLLSTPTIWFANNNFFLVNIFDSLRMVRSEEGGRSLMLVLCWSRSHQGPFWEEGILVFLLSSNSLSRQQREFTVYFLDLFPLLRTFFNVVSN